MKGEKNLALALFLGYFHPFRDKTGTLKIMAAIIRRESGRWQAKVRRHGLPPISRTFLTKAEAEAWARAQESEHDRGIWRDRSTAEATTLYSLLDQYARDVAPTKRGAEVEQLRIKTLQRDPISKHKLAALTPGVLAQWRDARLAGGAQGSTVNRELNLLSAVINWARKDLMIAIENPVAGIRRPPNGKARDRRLKDGEEQRLAEALTDAPRLVTGPKRSGNYRTGARNEWLLPLMLFAAETGMRRGELCLARWEHVDLTFGTLLLPAEITKTNTARTVPLSPAAQDVLRTLPRPNSDDPRIFPISPSAVTQAWRRARERAGLEDLRLHDLRHEAASRLFELGLGIMEVAAITGHQDLRSLKRYTHIDPAHLARKIADLKSQQQQPGRTRLGEDKKKKPG